MSLGPVMVDLAGTEMSEVEREFLQHPNVGGVILFSRNYESPQQIQQLVSEIHRLREPRLLVAVDHEGGRVQRFREGFTLLPPLGKLGDLYDRDKKQALKAARAHAFVMASELRAIGVDFSFTPVLDLDRGVSTVIGDRALHRDAQIVSDIAISYIKTMSDVGMASVGKHFPGHGAVEADSHVAIPVDGRSYEDIFQEDIVPFKRLMDNGLAAVMPAHVIYEHVDRRPAGFSPFWLQDVLRQRLGFQGVIFSDDLSMEGATVAGSHLERAEAALGAGCDMALVCNQPEVAMQVVESLKVNDDPVSHMRLARLHGRHNLSANELHRDPQWQQARQQLLALQDEPTLEMDL